MASRSALERQIRALDPDAVRSSLDEMPELIDYRDSRGRSWLHLCCSIDVSERADDVAASVTIADELLARGLELDDAAFVEDDGRWRASALWFAVARGRNLVLAGHLLDLGCDPNHSLWAAVHNSDLEAIDLLVHHGADIDPVVHGETPFLAAIKTSHFDAAWLLARHGADVDVVDVHGRTAMHSMLRKSSATEHFTAFAEFGPRVDIADPDGVTARDVLARKKDPALRALAVELG